jgi:hypothetical protein
LQKKGEWISGKMEPEYLSEKLYRPILCYTQEAYKFLNIIKIEIEKMTFEPENVKGKYNF